MDFSSLAPAIESLVERLKASAETESQPLVITALEALKSPTADEEAILTVLDSSERGDILSVGFYTLCEAVKTSGSTLTMSLRVQAALLDVIMRHLEHSEPRVRTLINEILGHLCRLSMPGTAVYTRLQHQLWSIVTRQLDDRPVKSMPTKLGLSKTIALDNVSGWRSLETALLALVSIVEACGRELDQQGLIDSHWTQLAVIKAGRHANRYVRQASMYIIRALAKSCPSVSTPTLVPIVAEGLVDAWPQVVYAATEAANALLLARLPRQQHDKLTSATREALSLLLPRLCLNRYMVPQGVHSMSQKAWMAYFTDLSGATTMKQLAVDALSFYVQAAQDDRSHFRRIAACYAIRELAAKIDTPAIASLAAEVLVALPACLEDAHWEVRVAACAALSQMAATCPGAVEARREQVVNLGISALEDQCWSIREAAAIMLADFARELPDSRSWLQTLLTQRLRESIAKARQQLPQSKEQAVRAFNDPQLHASRPMYGCCGGLESAGHLHKQKRYKAQPWEISDGAIYLLCELCADDVRPDGLAAEFLPLLADLTVQHHFSEGQKLQQTVWNVLPVIAQRLGNKSFKPFLELFFPPLLAALQSKSSSRLSLHAATICLEHLSRLIGHRIFLGRLPEEDRRLFLRTCTGQSGAAGEPVGFSGQPFCTRILDRVPTMVSL